jgi:hypothetical protein
MMKKVALMIGFLLLASSPTMAQQQVPKKFQGDWFDAHLGPETQSHLQIRINSNTIDFDPDRTSARSGVNFKEKIISVKPVNEDGNEFEVIYGGVPPANPVKLIWYLSKVNGRETLIAVNEEEPSAIFVYQRRVK